MESFGKKIERIYNSTVHAFFQQSDPASPKTSHENEKGKFFLAAAGNGDFPAPHLLHENERPCEADKDVSGRFEFISEDPIGPA